MKSEDYKKLYKGKNGCCVDHLGNYFCTEKSMCDSWKVSRTLFEYRLRSGWSVRDALTYNNENEVPSKDENLIWIFGEPFPSYHAVDIAFGFEDNVSGRHKDDMEEWLRSRGYFLVDGKLFRSYSELSREYGISENTICQRIIAGWSLPDAVHKPLSNAGRRGKECKDHLGNVYNSLREMLQHYGVTYACYYHRLQDGRSLEYALTHPMRKTLLLKPERDIKDLVLV